jgi:hypothetical protein
MNASRNTIVFLVLLAVCFLLLAMYSLFQYRTAAALEARNRQLQQELQKADAIADDSAAVSSYKKLPARPEIQLRILQRQWRIALEVLQYLQRARYNTELQNETGIYSERLKSLLDEMLDRSSSMLADSERLQPDIIWQTYNASGAAKLLSAFLLLEREQNVDKVQGVMRDALTDFKSAIEAVDKADVSPLQRNTPRWNFEMLNGEQFIKKIEVAKTDMEKNQVLKENLETLLPEMGGYAPGEPIETRIKK